MNNKKYSPTTSPYICLDYDGTLVEDNFFPSLGPFKPYAIETVVAMQKEGYNIHIWTSRPPAQFEDIINQLDDAGVDTTDIKVNEHFPYFLGKYAERSSKVYSDVYIDDRGYGAPEIYWPDIYRAFIGNK